MTYALLSVDEDEVHLPFGVFEELDVSTGLGVAVVKTNQTHCHPLLDCCPR